MQIAICDDDPAVLADLSDFINRTYRDMDMLVDTYPSGEALLAAMDKRPQSYDLLLLDIELAGLDGIRAAKLLHERLPRLYIVFITSHDEFALTGYEVSAFRFLAKPIQYEKLTEAITAVRAELLQQKTIQVESGGVEAVLKVRELVYIEAQDKSVRLVQRQQAFWDHNGIEFYAQLLSSEDFYRIHRSYLINLGYVTFLRGSDVQMVNGELLPVSRLRKRQFADAFRAYIKRTAR